MAPRSRSARRRTRRVLALTSAAALGALAVVAIQLQVGAAGAESVYQASKDRLDAALQRAQAAGYTQQQVEPIVSGESRLASSGDPLWVSDQPGYYQQRAQQLDRLRTQLLALEAGLLADERQSVAAALQKAADELGQATANGADPADLAQLHSDLSAAEYAEASARQPRDYSPIAARAGAVFGRAEQLVGAQQADLATIQQAAATLQTQLASDPNKLRQAAQKAIAAGRNDATVAAYLKLTAVSRPYHQLERYNALLQAAGVDATRLAMAAAGTQHYQQAVHEALLAAFPKKVVVISWQAEELWAYEGGKQVQDTLVTTGRPQLPTDLGAMKVLSKNSPWTMRSPWPRWSPWYYPPTTVQMAIWFTSTGESMHDAYWEPDYALGPGSQNGGYASHGCVHVAYSVEKFLYGWTEIGTPVVVIPGDGSTVANQVAQISVDANGEPTTGPKGV